MKLKEVTIRNFRNLVDVTIPIEDATILIGENNSGKTAFLDALKIILTRTYAGRGTPFDEYDYHMSKPDHSPQISSGIVIELWFRENESNEWSEPIIQALTEIIQTDPTMDIDCIGLRLSSKYDEDTKELNVKWEFLAIDGQVLEGRNPRNLTDFLSYIRIFYLSALRDSNEEFSSRSQYWGRILRELKITDEQREQLTKNLTALNSSLLEADPKLRDVIESLNEVQKIMGFGIEQKTSVQALPLKPWDLMSKSELVIKAGGSDVDFPLSRHGQGTQSLSVLFLFPDYIDILLKPTFKQETEAILTLEEPEAHLHPQATRALAANLGKIRSQKIISSHSPYFIQEIPLTQIRLFRRYGPSSKVFYIKRSFTVRIPNNPELVKYCNGNAKFEYNETTSILTLKDKMEEKERRKLLKIYSSQREIHTQIENLYKESQLYLSINELTALDTYVKRIRGEILFARSWLLCEGQCEYLLFRYFAELLGKPLDQYGVSVIDFQNNGSPGAFVGLAKAFGIPWIMICDNDDAGKNYIKEVKSRGFTDDEIKEFTRLFPEENMLLEGYLVSNGFADDYTEIIAERGVVLAKKQGDSDFESEIISKITGDKTYYTTALIERLRGTNADRSRVPKLFKEIIEYILERVE